MPRMMKILNVSLHRLDKLLYSDQYSIYPTPFPSTDIDIRLSRFVSPFVSPLSIKSSSFLLRLDFGFFFCLGGIISTTTNDEMVNLEITQLVLPCCSSSSLSLKNQKNLKLNFLVNPIYIMMVRSTYSK